MEAVKKSRPSQSHSEISRSFLGVQAKLSVNKPGDKYEVEADKAADRVVSGEASKPTYVPSASPVQLKEDDQQVQEKPLASTITPFVQAKEEEAQAEEEEPAQAKEEDQAQMMEEPATADKEPAQAKEDDQQVQEKPLASTITPFVQAKEEETQAKEEDQAQMMEESATADKEPAQAKEEESTQAKEEEVQAKEEEVQAKEDEPTQAKEEETQAKEEEAQAKEEEQLTVQAKEEESQAKEEEAQAKEEDQAQMMEEPATAEEEPAQAKEEDQAQMMEDDQTQAKEDELQAKFQPAPLKEPSAPNMSDTLRSTKGSGSPLSDSVKGEMESGFGADFSGVRIHTDSRAQQMSKGIGAQAFTNKGDVYFNEGKFNPASKEGKFLLAHELTHTIQQGAAPAKDAAQTDKTTPEQDKTTAPSTSDKTAPATPDGKVTAGTTPVPGQAAPGQTAPTTGATAGSSSGGTSTTVPAPTPIPTATPSKEPVTAADVKAGQDAAAEQVPEGAEGETAAEEKKQPSPEEDPDFLAVTGAIAEESDAQESKENPDALSEDALDAAKSPGNEAESFAQAEQVDEMEQQEPKEFSAENFKKLLKARIEEMQLPENNDEADKFAENNNIDEVNQKATGDVQAETAATSGAIDQSTNKDPNVKPEHKRKEEQLPPVKKSKKPKDVNAGAAVPKPRDAAEVEQPMADDTARMDNAMAENEVTDHQLEISQEPQFEQALGEKNKAKEESAKISQTARADESTTLQKNAAKSQKMSQEELQGMKLLNDQSVKKVTGDQKSTGSKDTSERERVAGEINTIYEKTKTDVNKILDDLDAKVEADFAAGSKKAKERFEKYCDDKMSQYKYDRYLSQIGGWALWTYDLFAGLPDEVNQFYVDGRKLFVETMDAEVDKLAHHIAAELNRATQRIETGKQEVNDYVEKLPKNLKQYGKEAADAIKEKFDELSEEVNAKEEELVDMLAEEYVASLKEVDERIEELKAANRGLIDMAMDFINGVLETIRKLKEAIMGLLSAIASAISVIMADPIGFMGNLFDGIGQGIDLFKANIQKHLLGGLLEWLTGAMGPMGITIPDDIFSLGGIFSLVLQVLGLGWDLLRMKAVKTMGEPAVNALETGADAGFSVFKAIKSGGIMGLWEFAKDKFTDLKETIIDAIKEMLITKVIEAGIKWLLSLLIPGAGFIKAIMAIKDIIVFFVETAIMLIPAITEAILALASGSVAGVAKAFEFGLSKLIVLVIGLFAKLIGLGDLAKRVQKIFKKIRKRVDKMVSNLFKKAKKAARKLLRKLGLTKKTKKKSGKEENDPNKQAKIDKGLAFLNKEEKKHLEDGKITREGAEKAAVETKKKHSVFTSFKVVDGKDSWDYKYTASPETIVEGEKKQDEEELKLEKGQAFAHKPEKKAYSALITKVTKKQEKLNYKYDYKKYKTGVFEMKFAAWHDGIKDGTISKIEKSHRDKILAEAAKYDEPLKGFIIGSVGSYRGNLIADLKDLTQENGGADKLRDMYKNADDAFKAKLEVLIANEKATKGDLTELFKGFEAHHVIPANFLRNNETVQRLLLQPGIEFGYNNLDNLIFIPSDNHTQGEQRGHPEYDKMISDKITEQVKPLVDQGNYDKALKELKKIIKDVKTQFINEIIGSNQNAKHIK